MEIIHSLTFNFSQIGKYKEVKNFQVKQIIRYRMLIYQIITVYYLNENLTSPATTRNKLVILLNISKNNFFFFKSYNRIYEYQKKEM